MISDTAAPPPAIPGPLLKRFAINVASLFSVNVANYLLPLFTIPYVVRIIGPERLGLLHFSQAYVAYFTLLINYGFDMAAVRIVAAERTNKALINQIFSEVMAGKALLLLISTVLFGLISANHSEFRGQLALHMGTYLGCFGAVLFPIWLFQAMEDLGRVALFNLVVKVLFTGSVFLMISQPQDFIYYNLSFSLAQLLVGGVALWVAVRRFQIRFSWPSFARLKVRFREDSTLFFSSVTIAAYSGSTIFLLGLLSSAYDVGIFSAGSKLENLARSFMGMSLNQALFPLVAKAFGDSREKGLSVVKMAFFPLLLLMVFVSLGLWIVAPWFINLFYGRAFSGAIEVLRLVAILPITIGISNLLGIHTMLNLRMDKAFFRITALGSVFGVLTSIYLIPEYTYKGATYAWIFTEVYIAVAMYFYLLKKGVQVIDTHYLSRIVVLSRTKVQAILNR